MGLELAPLVDCYVANPCTCIEYEHSVEHALQALFSVVFGPIVGFLIALIGHAIKGCVRWSLVDGPFQVVCLAFLLVSFRKQIGEFKEEVTKKELIVFNVVQIVSNLVIWGIDLLRLKMS